jgi:hypothetical protein
VDVLAALQSDGYPLRHLVHVCAGTRGQRRLGDLLRGQLVDRLEDRQA